MDPFFIVETALDIEQASSILNPAGVSAILRAQESVPEGEIEPEMLALVVVVNRMVGWTNDPPS